MKQNREEGGRLSGQAKRGRGRRRGINKVAPRLQATEAQRQFMGDEPNNPGG